MSLQYDEELFLLFFVNDDVSFEFVTTQRSTIEGLIVLPEEVLQNNVVVVLTFRFVVLVVVVFFFFFVFVVKDKFLLGIAQNNNTKTKKQWG